MPTSADYRRLLSSSLQARVQAHTRLGGIMQRPPTFVLPGAGVGKVLTGGAALQAAGAAHQAAQAQFGDVMGLMGRTGADPTQLLSALQQSVGAGKGTPIFQPTPMGGMLGLRIGAEDIMLPTAYGPFMLTPTQGGGVAMKVTGVRNRLELSNVLADQLLKESNLSDALVRDIRGRINEGMAVMRGGRADPGLMWAAKGNMTDFLKMNRGFVTQVKDVLNKNANVSMAQAMREVLETQKLGYHPLYGKPEAMLAGVFPAAADPTRIFPQGVAKGRPLYQDITFAGLFPQDVAAFEREAFGKRMPRIRTAGAAALETALGQGTEQGIMGRIGLLDPTDPRFRQMAAGAPGIEQVVISRKLAQNIRYMHKGELRKVGVGTPLKVAGQSVIIGGIADTGTMGGHHLLMAASNFEKHPDRYAQLFFGEAIHNALSTGRGAITIDDIGTFAHSGAKISGTPRQIIFTPNPKLAEMGMGDVTKKMAAALGVNLNAVRGGGALSVIGEIGVRGGDIDLNPSFGPAMATHLDFMSMAVGGPRARTIAQRQMSRAQRFGGTRAQSIFGFFGMFQGRPLPTSAYTNVAIPGITARAGTAVRERFRRVAPGNIDAQLISGLQNIRKVGDLQDFLASGVLPKHDIELALPRAIDIPGLGTAGGTVSTRHIPLPSVRGLERMMPDLSRLSGRALEEALEKPSWLAKYTAGIGRVLQTAAVYSAAVGAGRGVATAERALQEALHRGVPGKFEGLLPLMLSHTGGKRLIAEALQPPIPGSRAVYGRIVEGWGRPKLGQGGITGLPAMGRGEIGISESMARRLGMSWEDIRSVQGGFREHFIGQQYWPSIVPEAQAIKKVRIATAQQMEGLGIAAHDLISTNVTDRLAAFRDVDYDPTRLFTIRGQTQTEMKLAWEEHTKRLNQIHGRIQSFWSKAGARGEAKASSVLAATLGTGISGNEIRNLFAQKILAPRHHKMMRHVQAMLERQAAMGVDVSDAARVLGVVGQISGIKKGIAGEQGTKFFDLLERVKNVGPTADLAPTIAKVEQAISKIGPDARLSDVFMGLSPEQYRSVAHQITHAAAQLNDPATQDALRLMRLTTGKPLTFGELGTTLIPTEGRRPPSEVFPASHLARRMSMGALDPMNHPGQAEARFVQSQINAAAKAEGAAAKAEGGLARKLWANLPTGAKWALGGAGALVGLRMVKSALMGDEPAGEPMPSGAPLPPRPIGLGGGYHQGLAPAPMAPFNAPQARIISPMQRSPSVTMTATAPQGMDFQALGDRLVAAASSPAGMPLAGVFSHGISDPSRIDMNIAEDLRSQNRLYI